MNRRRLALGGLSVVTVLVVWELLLTTRGWNPFFMTTPSLIARAVWEQIVRGQLAHDIGVSAQAFVTGFTLSVLVGIPVGLIMGWRRRAGWALDPLLTA